MDNHIVAFESDLGSRTPVGWGFTGGEQSTIYFKSLVDTYFPVNIQLLSDLISNSFLNFD